MIIKYKNQIFNCLLDAEDSEYFSQFNWYYRCGYAGRRRTKKDTPGNHWVHLHREVLFRAGLEIPEDMIVDHINRNKMDNRKSNLRVTTISENSKNVSDETTSLRRQNIANATIAAALQPRTNIQLKNSSESAKRMNASGKNIHAGKDNYHSKRVTDISTGISYENIRIAATTLGLNYSTLRQRLNGSLENTTTLIVETKAAA